MRAAWMARLRVSASAGTVLLLAACSGGGGGGVASTPAPVPAPSPTPTPTPVPTPTPTPTPSANYDTAEYRATVGAVSMNALTAYQHGGTGAGIKVGVIDSGVDLQSAEFGDCSGGIGTGSCRIDAASRDLAGNSSIDDEGGHGTAVAFTLAGRRNDAGTQGVAFDARLVVLRTDTPGSCAKLDDKGDPQCSHNDRAIADALDVARGAGARVVNISLGGSAPSSYLLQAINRATAAGIVIVVSAGNDGTANPDPFTSPATDPSIGRGLIVIAGSVNAADQISSFSDRAGASRAFYLAAVGESVRAPDENNTPYLWSGTSFSAPQIAGAVALLAQAFPNLTGAQIVQLLYQTARDAGDPGVDPVYGNGILDLTRAFQPVGQTSIAGASSARVAAGANAHLSAPMGDARQGALGAVVLDGFSRAFASDFAASITREGPGQALAGLMATRDRSFAVGIHQMSVAVTLVPTHDSVRIDRLSIGSGDARRARAIAASVTGQLGGHAQFAFGAAQSGTSLVARLSGRDDPAFLIARDPTTSAGFDSEVGGSAAVRALVGGWGVTVAAENGQILTGRDSQAPALRWRPERWGYSRATVGLDRRFGGLKASVTATRLDEADTLLGAHFSEALGAARATSAFLDLGARYDWADGWTLGGSMRQGWTWAKLRSGVRGDGLIRTNGFAADLGKAGVFGGGDRFGLRIAQPLRVASGGIDYLMPTDWDYATMSVSAWSDERLNLAPQGREVDFELSYGRPFLMGDLGTNVFVRRQPGNFAALAPDVGGALRLTWGF